MTESTEKPIPPRPGGWRLIAKYAVGLAPFVVVWLLLVVWLAGLLISRAEWSEQADDATLREWLEETRPFRKTLPEMIRDYVNTLKQVRAGTLPRQLAAEKRTELLEQIRVLVEPTRVYLSQLPGFPVVYGLSVVLGAEFDPDSVNPVVWQNTLPQPRQQNQTRVRVLDYAPLADLPEIRIRCEYQMHAFNKLQQREVERRRESLVAGAVLVAATLLATLFVGRFLAREWRRESMRLVAAAESEHRERELLETRLRQQESERAREDLHRELLERQLQAAGLEGRAAAAENTALEMKSQMYASINIMAGSYAHNIKNLLVRPNDLLGRCLETQGLAPEQSGMLHEVRSTLTMVTERLQQILKTVRRDPAGFSHGNQVGDSSNTNHAANVDLEVLVRQMAASWSDMAREKWKLHLKCETPVGGRYLVRGDHSHLQQALENLLFNGRDATFEMRNNLRDQARRETDADRRRQRLLEAAAWKGEVLIRLRREEGMVLLDVQDNGIGMTDEVRANCLQTHFTTKRDNAIYEGYSAGMGLGLSFVAMVLERHNATLEIESTPEKGTEFRIRFSSADLESV